MIEIENKLMIDSLTPILSDYIESLAPIKN